MNGKVWLGLILIVSSYGQALLPNWIFDDPGYTYFGYAFLPANLLAFSMSLFALGVIVLGEGVCQRFGGASLLLFAISTPWRLPATAVTAAVSGLALEAVAQWLGKLWFYPYWTTWFYWLMLVPGFAFYWVAIVESYLAAKAILDAAGKASPGQGRALAVPGKALGVSGLACLAGAAWLFGRWFAEHGWDFAVVRPVPHAPLFSYALLAFAGTWLVCEGLLSLRSRPSLVDSVLKRYWVPPVAVLASSAVLGLAMETQNTLHYFWRYSHWPWPQASVAGVQVSVLATWPLQYVVLLLVSSVLTPGLAAMFWSPGPFQRSGLIRRCR